MNEQKTTVAAETVSSYVIEAWKCPKCGASNKFNPNICTSCNYSKIPPVQVLPPQSRKVWETISKILIGVMLVLQLAYAASMALGFGLNLLYGIGGQFLESALICPDLILYSHYGAAGMCVLLAVITALGLVRSMKDKERLTGSLHTAAVSQIVAAWSFPVINILTDMVVTSVKVGGTQLRSSSAYDLFDMGITIIPGLIISAAALIVIYVNNRLGSSEEEPEEE